MHSKSEKLLLAVMALCLWMSSSAAFMPKENPPTKSNYREMNARQIIALRGKEIPLGRRVYFYGVVAFFRTDFDQGYEACVFPEPNIDFKKLDDTVKIRIPPEIELRMQNEGFVTKNNKSPLWIYGRIELEPASGGSKVVVILEAFEIGSGPLSQPKSEPTRQP